MAEYQITAPLTLFKVRDPQQLVDFNLATLNATINFPDKTTYINDSNTVLYTAEQLLGGCIVRSGRTGSFNDTVDTGANIIDAMRRKLLASANKDNLRVGDSVTCALIIQGECYVQIVGNDNSDVCYPNYLYGGSNGNLFITITDLASLGEGHSDYVTICVCGGYED